MKTAIIYRSNPNLDAMLSGLKDKVDLFYVFPASATESEIQNHLKRGGLLYKELCICTPEKDVNGKIIGTSKKSAFDNILCDLTCYSHLPFDRNARVITQSNKKPHEEYIYGIAHQAHNAGMGVAIISECLAHHCELDNVDYKERWANRDGWYLDMVLKTWLRILSEESVDVQVVSSSVDLAMLHNKIVVCDHHNNLYNGALHNLNESGELTLVPAYCYACSSEKKFIGLDEIPILFEE